jgi:hypothetical protein
MAAEALYIKGPVPLQYASSQAAHGNITVSGVPNCLQYCVIFIGYTPCRNVAAGPNIVVRQLIQSVTRYVQVKTVLCLRT